MEILRFIDPASVSDLNAGWSDGELAVFDAINQKVAAAESIEQIIDFVFDSTRSMSPCDRIGVAFFEENGRRVTSHYAKALYHPLLLAKGYSEDLRGSSLEGVLDTGRVRVINDLDAYFRRRPYSASTALLVREGVRSSMTCPLAVDDRRVGLLFRSARIPNAYGEREVRMHLAIAERLSQAIEKAYRIEQLAAANRAYGEMLGFVSHELKSPLASIVMDVATLTEGYYGELAEPQREKVQRVADKANYLLSLIRDYLDLARIEGGELALDLSNDVDFMEDIALPAADMLRPQIEERGSRLTWQTPENQRIHCDPALLKVVMVNLIGNAVKYGSENGEVRVTLARTPRGITVAVWNEGPGFPENERPRLFRKFSRIPTPTLGKRPGTGVGLYTVWRIVELHGGAVRAESEAGRWASFGFEMPQPIMAAISKKGDAFA
ncbi:MAG TPA: GAF domain-containing sensor histidine kinase [Candidatus Hydrogenedentes bacterium]|nr:GAF domain-containing sensor histidine kinase [Candidatus Hydrogenedentota bacterium]